MRLKLNFFYCLLKIIDRVCVGLYGVSRANRKRGVNYTIIDLTVIRTLSRISYDGLGVALVSAAFILLTRMLEVFWILTRR